MKYAIRGVDSKTGVDRNVTVEAQDEKEAGALAKQQGLFPISIASVMPPLSPAPPPMSKQKPQTNPVAAVIGLVVVGAGIWFYFGGGLEKQAQKDLGHIQQQVAEDAVKQYEIAKRSGSAMDACVHAGLVAAAYLQAKDEANYQRWKQIEAEDCRRAGAPAP